MKSVKDTLLQRVSCRRYERESLTSEQVDFIYKAIANTPTSYNGQQYSVVDVSDQSVKERLYEVIGQKQVKTCARFMLFCMDYHKIMAGAKAKGVDMPSFYDTFDGVTVAMLDATLAMMSAITAAESMGLGTCPIGYARTVDPERVAEIIGLPQHVMVVCGLAIGVPREHNDLKPKQPVDLLIHQNQYRSDDLGAEMMEYDNTVTEYNHNRAGGASSNDWIAHIIGYYSEAMNYRMVDALKKRGFDIKK